VLVVAGGFQSAAGDGLGKSVEEQRVGLEAADLVGAEGLPLAFDPGEGAAAPVALGGHVAAGPAAEVLADDAAVDPPGAGVVRAVLAAAFPGHGRLRSGGLAGALHKSRPNPGVHNRVGAASPRTV
jgi:hypothetical protein